jgi:hypothetical protein
MGIRLLMKMCLPVYEYPIPDRYPTVSLTFILAFPIPNSKLVQALNYGESLWGKTTKVIVRLLSGETENYFLKVESRASDDQFLSLT